MSLFLPISRTTGVILSCLFVAAILGFGTKGVDKLNRFLMFGLISTYVGLIMIGLSSVQMENLVRVHWKASAATLPILFICFGFQNLVPSVVHYLERNVTATRRSIIFGNMIPLLCYALWNYVILGMVADPVAIASENRLIAHLTQHFNPRIEFFVQAFSFFALFTSFITTAISFADFLRDGFKKPPSSILVHGLVLIPPLAISLSYPNLFLKALGFAGGVIDIFLYGILPIVIVWMGRKKTMGPYQVAGGNYTLAAMLLASFLFLAIRLL